MKRALYYLRTVELVLIFALVLYNIKTWLDRRNEGDNREPGAHYYVWAELLQDWQLVALQVALPAFFISTAWKTAITFNDILRERSSCHGSSSLLLADDGARPPQLAGSHGPVWRPLLAAKFREENVFLGWFFGGCVLLFILHFLGLGTNEHSFNATWDYVTLTASGYLLYASLYISFVRLLCLPFLVVAKAWSDESAFLPPSGAPPNHTESPWQPLMAGAFAVTLWSALGWTALLILPVAGLAYYLHIKGQGRHLWLALHRRYTAVLARGDEEYRRALLACTILVCFMILWANAYFDSLILNLGLILVFAAPIYFIALSSPALSGGSGSSSLRKALINPALLVFVSLISGFLVVLTALPDMRFTQPPSEGGYLGPALLARLLPEALSVAIAQAFFTLSFHLCLFLAGLYWVLLEDRLPGVPTTWRNLASVVLTMLILLLWNPIIPSRGTNLHFIGAFSTYTHQLGRFLSGLAGFYFAFWFLTLARTWCDRPNTSPLDKLVYRTRYGLLYLHPILVHVCGSAVVALQQWFTVLSAPSVAIAITWLAVVSLGCFASSLLPRSWVAAPKYRRPVSDDVPSHSLI